MSGGGRRAAQNRVKSMPVTATIDRELLEWLDELVSKRAFRSRSQAINASLYFFKQSIEENPQRFFGRRTPQQIPPASPPIQNRGRQQPR